MKRHEQNRKINGIVVEDSEIKIEVRKLYKRFLEIQLDLTNDLIFLQALLVQQRRWDITREAEAPILQETVAGW
uniref:Uncharacterized protein n=1 Tax=Oryza nivara TaxID=4536 RepID=A0A0E0I5V5_ORYNI